MLQLHKALYHWQHKRPIVERQNVLEHILVPEKAIVALGAVLALQIIRKVGVQAIIEAVRIVEDSVNFIGDLLFDFSLVLWRFLGAHLVGGQRGSLLGR